MARHTVVGDEGETAVALRLVDENWSVECPGRDQANFDLIAVRGDLIRHIQVKATDARTQHSHRDWLLFGYASPTARRTGWFNRVSTAPSADLVVSVILRANEPLFIVLPVAVATDVCNCHYDYWSGFPKRDGSRRQPKFGMYIRYLSSDSGHREHYDRLRTVLRQFEGRFDIVERPKSQLHDASAWKVGLF